MEVADGSVQSFSPMPYALHILKVWIRMTVDFAKVLGFSPKRSQPTAMLLLIAECLLVPVIIATVSYTEIDWKAYMQEVEGFLNGTRDYHRLEGDTGPLVYPAGFVYIYSVLYWITDRGQDVFRAQGIFGLIYLINTCIVLRIYTRVAQVLEFPPFLLAFLCLTAYRIHSIFVLRMFNDSIAMTILYFAVLLMMEDHWAVGYVVYSLAVSVKMNILLFGPGLLVLLLRRKGIRGCLLLVTAGVAVQALLGLPFLSANPTAYLTRAFDMGRVFLFKWTVNWRFLPEWVFLSQWFHLLLLIFHASTLILFCFKQWLPVMSWKYLFTWRRDVPIDPQEVLYVLFTSNLIGVCFARSLHYQFYMWYFHSLPLLIHWTRLSTYLSVCLLLAVEYCWNVYPSTVFSSLLLHCCHATILLCLLASNAADIKKSLTKSSSRVRFSPDTKAVNGFTHEKILYRD